MSRFLPIIKGLFILIEGRLLSLKTRDWLMIYDCSSAIFYQLSLFTLLPWLAQSKANKKHFNESWTLKFCYLFSRTFLKVLVVGIFYRILRIDWILLNHFLLVSANQMASSNLYNQKALQITIYFNCVRTTTKYIYKYITNLSFLYLILLLLLLSKNILNIDGSLLDPPLGNKNI